MTLRNRLLHCLLASCLLAGLPLFHAWAGTPATWQGSIAGTPAWITVVPRGHEIADDVRSEPWWAWGNAETDAYLFAFESPTNVVLVLDFALGPEALPEARFFLHDWGTKPVEYDLSGDQLTILSNDGYPTVTVSPQGSAWLIGDQVNYDLLIQEDGYLCDERIAPDGVVDFTTRVGGNGRGEPQWEVKRRDYDARPQWGCGRFTARTRMPDSPPFRVTQPLMPSFPYFDIGARSPLWFAENPTPLYLDLRTYDLKLNSLVGFQIGGIYAVGSNTYPPRLQFESPFVYYNFDPTTRQAHLVIRAGTFRAGSPFGHEPFYLERTTFRYSWKTWDNQRWNYAIHVAGFYPYDEDVEIGGERFTVIAPDHVPTWITEKPWPLITFVEATEGYTGSEGIYFYSAQAAEHWPWLSGATDQELEQLPAPFLPDGDALVRLSDVSLPIGFRGEYNAAYFRNPTLYFSPIDRRMHLLNAVEGIWNLGGGRVLRTKNRNGDAYIDTWLRERIPDEAYLPPELHVYVPEGEAIPPRALPGTVEEILYAQGEYLVYGGNGIVDVRRADLEPATFTTSPPTDETSWEEFRQRLPPDRPAPADPLDMLSWLDAITGTFLRLNGAELLDFQATDRGFRATVDLWEGAAVTGTLATTTAFPILSPGRHMLDFDSETSSWTARPATLPKLSMTLTSELREYHPGTVNLDLANTGSMDWTGAAKLYVSEILIGQWDELRIPGNGSIDLTTAWNPPVSRNLRLRLVLSDGQEFASNLPVQPSPPVERVRAFWLSSGSIGTLTVLILLVALGIFSIQRISRQENGQKKQGEA